MSQAVGCSDRLRAAGVRPASDLSGFYFFEPLDLVTLVEEALSRFNVQLREQEFKVHLDVQRNLARRRAWELCQVVAGVDTGLGDA